MTIRESEKLAKLEQKVDDLSDDFSEMRKDIKDILTKLNDQDHKFVSKQTMAWVVGLVVTAASTVVGLVLGNHK